MTDSATGADASQPPTPHISRIRWLAILLGLGLGPLAVAPVLALGVWFALALGYIACKPKRWPRLQLFFAYLIGGLSAGAGVVMLVRYDRANRAALGWLCLAGVIAGARALFLWMEARFALIKPVREPPPAAEPRGVPLAIHVVEPSRASAKPGVSAWAGDWEGTTPEGGLRWTYRGWGEIAMSGPTFGEVRFSNGILLRWVGPAFAVSDDGAYAAFPIPSRERWRLLLLSIRELEVRYLNESRFWEVDEITGGWIHGRPSPLTNNSDWTLEIVAALRQAPPTKLVENDAGEGQGTAWVIPD